MSKSVAKYTLNDIRNEVATENLFVLVRASKHTRVPTTVVLTHTSQNTGDVRSISIPMTTIPINMADFVPRDEILRNPEFLRLIRVGILEPIAPEDAERILNSEEGRIEMDRLRSDMMRTLESSAPNLDGNETRVVIPEEIMRAQGAPGDIDREAEGVNPAIAGIMHDNDRTDAVKAALLRNIISITELTSKDREFVRRHSADETIRNLVAGS
jgi:hypothetical protein